MSATRTPGITIVTYLESARPCFADCATRYLAQSHARKSLEAIRIHVRLLLKYVGDLQPHQVHDATLAPMIVDRIAAGASATTINRTLEVARTILNRAARSYRDGDGRPGSKPHHHCSRCFPSPGDRPTRSPGTNRIDCSRICRHTCNPWRCSP